VSRLYKELLQVSNKKTNNPLQTWAEPRNGHLSMEDIRMARKHTKKCKSTLSKMPHHAHEGGWDQDVRCWLLEDKSEPWCTSRRSLKSCCYFSKQSIKSQMMKHRFTSRPSNSIPRYTLKKNENICPNRTLYTNVYSNIIHDSWKQPEFLSTDNWINKIWSTQTMEHSLFSHKNKVLIPVATRWNTMLSERSQTQWTTGYIIHVSGWSGQGNPQRQKGDWWLFRTGLGAGG
jgi:hypothetical protein